MRICLNVDVNHALKAMDFLKGLNETEDHQLIGVGFGAVILAMVKARGLARARRYILREREKLHDRFSMDNLVTLERVTRALLATLMKHAAVTTAVKLEEYFEEMFNGKPVEGVNALAFNILSGEEELLVANGENAFKVLAAAVSFPPVYEPVHVGDGLYCNLTYMAGVPRPDTCDLLVFGISEFKNTTPKNAASIMEKADKLRTHAIMRRRLSVYKKTVRLCADRVGR